MENALAYYGMELISAVKCFYDTGPSSLSNESFLVWYLIRIYDDIRVNYAENGLVH